MVLARVVIDPTPIALLGKRKIKSLPKILQYEFVLRTV